MAFKVTKLEIPEVLLIEPVVLKDERGFFMETYKASEFERFGIKDEFIQDNHSKSTRSVLRGLHYQKNPKAQAKLVRVTQGEIFDVAVDIRRGSPTFGKWVGALLSEENKAMLYIPVGFAHGLCVVSESAELLYKVTAEYSKEHDSGIAWNDPEIGITWPVKEPTVSAKDSRNPFLKDMDITFAYSA